MDKTAYVKYMRFVKLLNEEIRTANDYEIMIQVLENFDHLMDISIETIAENADVSVPSVSRFMKKMNYDSVKDFKMQVNAGKVSAMELEKITHLKRFHGAGNQDVVQQIKQRDLAHIEATIQQLDLLKLEQIVRILRNSKRVIFLGDSMDLNCFYLLQTYLIALGIPAVAFLNEYVRSLHEMRLTEQDTIVFASSSIDFYADWEREMIQKGHEQNSCIIMFHQDEIPDQKETDVTYQYGIPGSQEDTYYSLYLIADILTKLFLNQEILEN